jgi:hypothetical protein
MRSFRKAFFVFAINACSVQAMADDVISTDRPDFVESSDVVGRGVAQIETGLNYERDTQTDIATRTYTTPTLLRFGVGRDLELRLETDGRISRNTSSETQTGFADLSVGVKWRVADSDRGRQQPSVAVLLHADVASGSSAFRGVGMRPSLRATAEWDIGATGSLGVMPGVVYDQSDEHRFLSGIFAVTASRQLIGRLRGFMEVAGRQFAHAEDGGTILTYDTGLSYLLVDSVQIDCAFARGANRNTPEWNFGAGISVRL